VRIGIVVPYVKRVRGNRCAFTLARALAERHETRVYVDTMLQSLEPEVRRALGHATLKTGRFTDSPDFRMRTVFALQIRRGRDRALAQLSRRDPRANPLDVLRVAANEGHWLAEYVRGWGVPRPVTAVWVYDLIDQVFLLGHRRPWPTARRLAFPAYRALHEMERGRLASFDRRFGLSEWSTQLVSLLYGLPIHTLPAAVDTDRFLPSPSPGATTPHIVVPTVSLDETAVKILQHVHALGVPMVSFGPRAVPGIEHRGYVDDPTMVRMLSDARATLFLFDYEAFGLVPFESLACGTPVITLPREGPWGELRTNPWVRFGRDPESIAAACREFLSLEPDPSSRSRRRESIMEHSPDAVAKAFLNEVAPTRTP
jgi:glycosyltransferase involved in cell wall biosynthesis